MGRNHSPIPPPREPRRDPDRVYGEPYERRGAPPARDVYANPPRERRRQRSVSPSYRRSPPPRPKRYRPGDEDYYDTGRFDRSPRGRRGGPHYDGYDDSPHGYGGGEFDGRGPPPPPPGRPKREGPLTFKDFMLQRVEDDPSPEEAQQRYQEYLVEFHGSMLKAEFAARRDQRDVRKQFDPREAEKAIAVRQEEAAAAAAALAVDIADGKYDPSSEAFNQGTLEPAVAAEDGMEAAAAVEGSKGPPLLWKSERVAADVKLSRRLMAVVDAEKGVTVNPLLAPLREKAEAAVAAQREAAPAAAGAEGGAGEGDAAAAEAAQGGAMEGQEGAGAEAGAAAAADAAANGADKPAEPMATDAATAAAAAGTATAAAPAAEAAAEQDPAAQLAAALDAAIKAEGPDAAALEADAAAMAAALGQLDLVLTWLWRVHGVDYYGGVEVVDADEFAERLGRVRTLRGPQPEEGEEQDEAESKKDAEAIAKSVDERWAERIKSGDPVLKKCQRDKVTELVDKWVQDQVVKHDEHKWGSTVSAKLFMEERFVLKHIRNKHDNKVEEARQGILDDLYWEAYRAAHEEEEKEHQRTAGPNRQGSGFGGRGGGRGYGGSGEYYDDGSGGYDGGWDGGYGGRGGGRGLGRGGRGRRGMMLDAAPMGMGMGMGINPAAMMAGMGGPIFIPIAGAGPMGPILGAPQALGGMMGAPMEMDPSALMGMMGGGRGRAGMQGRGGRGPMGGRGGGRGAGLGGGREYYDLDNPRHNRAVLDYSDL